MQFYKVNMEILNLDPFNERDLLFIRFNQWIIRKENLSRLNSDRGTFELALNKLEKEFEISRGKVQRMVKWFEDKGIIKCLEKSSVKGKPSVYAYTTIYCEVENAQKSDTKSDTERDTEHNTNKLSNSNGLNEVKDTISDTVDDTKSDNIEIENLNREFKKNIYSRVIEKLNSTTNSNFKASTKKTQSLINARMKEGFTVEDFETVINKKSLEWLGTDMQKYLRPETLFGTKFEGYLNQKEKTPTAIGANKNKYNPSICKTRKDIPVQNEIDLFA